MVPTFRAGWHAAGQRGWENHPPVAGLAAPESEAASAAALASSSQFAVRRSLRGRSALTATATVRVRWNL